jgi:phosphoribosyl 1,2-cyclic phosphodiesterase
MSDWQLLSDDIGQGSGTVATADHQKSSPDRISMYPHAQTPAVRCWGVRGNFPSLEKNQYRYGGHTTSIEICLGDRRLIFDGGSGLCSLGQSLSQEHSDSPSHFAQLFFTRTHWDRIQGFPFFLPAFEPQNRLEIYGPLAVTGASIKQQLMDQMRRPYCAVSLRDMKANLRFQDIKPGQSLALGDDIVLEVFNLSPVEPVLGYRITWQDWVLIYATAIEIPQDDRHWEDLLAMADQADLMIYGTADSDHDWRAQRHPLGEPFDPLTVDLDWQAGLHLAEQAKVKRLVVVRHRPFCSDQWLGEFEQAMVARFPQSELAREGQLLALP